MQADQPIDFKAARTDAPVVLEGGFRIRSQEDLDELVAAAGDTSFRIAGFLSVGRSDLTSLAGLSNLTGVGGTLSIERNEALASLEGLNNLTYVGDGLSISENASLTTLEGLNNLTHVAGRRGFQITDNDALTSVGALSNLANLEDDLQIGPNEVLSSLEGLNELLSTYAGDLSVTFTPALTDLALPDVASFRGSLSIAGRETPALVDTVTSLAALSSLTSIGGSLSIDANTVSSLEGLENLTSIGGGLTIVGRIPNTRNPNGPALISLRGLNNLTSVEGRLDIRSTFLTSLEGLDNLRSVGETLYVGGNPLLTSLEGPNKLTSLGGSLAIEANALLTSLEGLNNLTAIGETLHIANNPLLTSLDGLNTLTSVGSDDSRRGLTILSNPLLTSLEGLNNLASVGGSIQIAGVGLTSLNAISDLLSSYDGTLDITFAPTLTDLGALGNLTRFSGSLFLSGEPASLGLLANLTHIEGDLALGRIGREVFTNLEGLGLTNLTSVGGGLFIAQTNTLTNLTGLNSLASIGGGLSIAPNNTLTSLMGLNSLTSIDGGLWIGQNSALTSLEGLDSLTDVGGDLSIAYNPLLTSLEGLGGLTGVGGNLVVQNNEHVGSLEGLANIASLGGNLEITGNRSLLAPPAQALADRLVDAGFPGEITIRDNHVVTRVAVRFADDSPDDGEGGAVVQEVRLILNGQARPEIQSQVIRRRAGAQTQVGQTSRATGEFRPHFYASSGLDKPLFADYYYRLDHEAGGDVTGETRLDSLVAEFSVESTDETLSADGGEHLVYLFDVSDVSQEDEIQSVEIEAVLGNDYRVDMATLANIDPRCGDRWERCFFSTPYRTVLQAEGNVQDLSNQQQVHFGL